MMDKKTKFMVVGGSVAAIIIILMFVYIEIRLNAGNYRNLCFECIPLGAIINLPCLIIDTSLSKLGILLTNSWLIRLCNLFSLIIYTLFGVYLGKISYKFSLSASNKKEIKKSKKE